MSEDFASAPLTIGELRSNKTANGKDWTPREALVSLLRQIDKGEIKVDMLVIAWHVTDKDGAKCCDFVNATPSMVHALGLVSRAAYRVNQNADPD